MRARALVLTTRLLFVVIAVGALVALVTRVGQYPVTGGPVTPQRQDGPCHIVVASGPGGALVYSADSSPSGSGGARLTAYRGDGSALWSVGGVDDAIPAALPGAVFWRSAAPSGDGGGGGTTVVRVDQDGREIEVAEAPPGELRPWFADSACVVYAETTHDEAGLPHSRIVTVDGTHSWQTVLPEEGGIEHVSVASDGRRLAAISTGGAGYVLSWFAREPGEPWQLVAQAPTSSRYVALAPDGNHAVLGPERPVLVEFGETEGQVLPVEYVSEARFGSSALLLVYFRVQLGQPVTSVSAVDTTSNEIEWTREFGYDLGVASNADLSQLAYIQAGADGVVVVDMASWDERILPVNTADDLGFRDDGHLFVALRDGALQVTATRSEE
jgi:hypothetical protein